VLRILLAIWGFMRWCEDLLWEHSEFAHKSQLCSSLNARTKARLEAAGFDEINTRLHEEPTQFLSMDELARFLKTVVLGHHLKRLPESERGNTLLRYGGRRARTHTERERRAPRGLRLVEHLRESRGGHMRSARPQRTGSLPHNTPPFLPTAIRDPRFSIDLPS
jgi:hypothetical protein